MQLISVLLAQAASPGIDTQAQFLRGELNPAFVTLCIGALTLLLICGMLLYNSIHRRNVEVELKRELLDRGLSADEIERVLAAKLVSK